MTIIQRSALVPYAADAMYQLVNAIEAYPQFMDGCVGAEILSQDDTQMEARLDLAKAGMRYSFVTRNQLYPPHRIQLTLVEGPFDKRLLDAAFVRQQETLVTRGYRRLKEIAALDLPIIDYPLPEVRAARSS